ncbi:biopolymer transporter ExbD [Hyphomonas sp. GM-8P]|uniref:ExbD/TolR family protein n=1 Tax=Hyphomonas sp. GM-8P TaxID=1280945 RepID=UPI000DD344E0|nr:biopolymer transporter ExbD [Hyphomonas sp. GM-8P]
MRGRHQTRAGTVEVSLTPMLDVVFILLIFFMVTSTFTQEQAIRLEPPATGTGASSGKAMLIRISEDAVVRVDGRTTDIGAVLAAIERKKAETPDIQIAIEVEPKAKSGLVTLIRDAAYDAGYTEGVSIGMAQSAEAI